MTQSDQSIEKLPGVGPKVQEKLERLGIKAIRDLLFYYPRRWDDFSKPQSISSLRINDDAIIKAKIMQIKQSRTRRKWMSIIEALLADDSGQMKAIWFNQPFLMKLLKPGDEWLFAGKVGYDRNLGVKTLNVYQYEKDPAIFSVYSETEGITSKFLRKLIKPLTGKFCTREVHRECLEDYLPDDIVNKEDLVGLSDAIRMIHFPEKTAEIEVAKKRLAFDELFLIGLRMLSIKKELSQNKAIALKWKDQDLKEFVNVLPFKLTNAQRKTAWEIIQDLGRDVPMNRLLEGDVGSGKTVVAAMAVLVAAKNKMQTVWLAPTEILANQHFKNVAELLSPFDLKVGLLTAANKNALLEKDDLIIGTHAILQKDVTLPRLGLIIVDEQHRFGVKQRAHLRQGNDIIPHLLSMTATPIPRSLALALYGDLDISIIDELPAGRQKIITKVVSPEDRNKAYQFIESQVKAGRQVFVICPLIESQNENSNKLFDIDKKSAIEEHEKLSKNIFPHLKIGLLHGRMKSKEKDEAMGKFKKGEIDILVSTAVVEVGIDIPNATVMMIEGADRFGLAQLHQFRGRVGRGEYQSYCLLFSESWSEKTKQRLEAMTKSNSGFELAQIDLEIRGPGELVGIRQSGLPDLKMASLSDIIMVKKARLAAEKIVQERVEKYPKLLEKISEFETERHLE